MLLILLCMPLFLHGAADSSTEFIRIVPQALSLRARCLDVICRYEIEPPLYLQKYVQDGERTIIYENLDIYVEHRVHKFIADFIRSSHYSCADCKLFLNFFRSNLLQDVRFLKTELLTVSPEILRYVCVASFSWRTGKPYYIKSGHMFGLVSMPWAESMRASLFDESEFPPEDLERICSKIGKQKKTKKKKKFMNLLLRK